MATFLNKGLKGAAFFHSKQNLENLEFGPTEGNNTVEAALWDHFGTSVSNVEYRLPRCPGYLKVFLVLVYPGNWFKYSVSQKFLIVL